MHTRLNKHLEEFADEHSINLRILAKLFGMTRSDASPVCFSVLAEEMRKEDIEIEEFSSNIDRLFDFGIISSEWRDVDGFMTRTLRVAGEAEWLASLSYFGIYGLTDSS